MPPDSKRDRRLNSRRFKTSEVQNTTRGEIQIYFQIEHGMASIRPPQFNLNSSQTAVAFIIPDHLKSDVNAIRRIHDKAFHKWEPHINVLYPFVDLASLSSAAEALHECLHNRGDIQSIQLNIGSVGTFRHRRNATVFLKPGQESAESLCSLRKALIQALGCEEKEGTRDGIFRPHLTIGQTGFDGSSVENLVKQVEKLVGLEWEGRVLTILEREKSGKMRVFQELPLHPK